MASMQSVIEILSQLDQKDTAQKDIPVAHYLIDLRAVMLVQKVAKAIGKNQSRYRNSIMALDNHQGLSEHQLGHLLQFLNEKFGQDIA